MTLNTRHQGSLLLVVCSLLLASLSLLVMVPSDASGQPPAPTIEITSPSAGATVKGNVTITATSTAGAGDHPTSIVFYDGVNGIGSTNCENQQTCTASIQWHATGLSGQHSLTARVQTSASLSATSTPVLVMVVSPPPTVSITTPSNGSTVKGTVTVSVSGATDPSQVEYPTSITIYDGVNNIGSISCQGQPTCQGSVSWHATGLSGPHVLTAKMSTDNSLSVTSPAVTVTVVSPPPTVTITSPKSGTALRGVITVAVAGSTDPSQVDYPTSIAVFDGTKEIGNISCQGQPSCAGSLRWDTKGLTGRHILIAVIHTDKSVSANSAPVVVGGVPARPHAVLVCHLASLSVPLKRRDQGVCSMHRVPTGTRVTIQYRNGSGGWTTAVQGRVAHARFTFSLHGVKRATYQLAILVNANRVFAATRTYIGTLHIG